MKTTHLFLSLMACVLMISCGEQAQEEMIDPAAEAAQWEQERAEALEAIEAANAAIPSLTSQGKFEEAGAYFMEDVVQIISGQPAIRSRADWIAAQQQAAAIGDWDLELEVLDFEYMGDQAVERGRGVQTFTANENSPMPSMQSVGDYMVLWVKTETGWKIQYDYVVIQQPEMP
ncbi:Ketosteroid isomerase homolog [Robiginitalea myxolifaciens]|uniref:Ketosteroid isomerase homolog n=1 Tax=Robiginitalea myxolifaciens TaxID=400055 RepID=A0A1I6H8A5_9FLAO|nr:nuclear transport factor 2 family protein [Robiginitalea myxolifaciens]SFR50672.1 Ketosteroid isomerase homolog [Robiginitalea myxolifaciens]